MTPSANRQPLTIRLSPESKTLFTDAAKDAGLEAGVAGRQIFEMFVATLDGQHSYIKALALFDSALPTKVRPAAPCADKKDALNRQPVTVRLSPEGKKLFTAAAGIAGLEYGIAGRQILELFVRNLSGPDGYIETLAALSAALPKKAPAKAAQHRAAAE